jgi:hypothetical protein
MPMPRRAVALAVFLGLAALPAAAQQDLVYTAVSPCRIVDTRSSTGGVLVVGAAQTFNVAGGTNYSGQGGSASGCGIPGFAGSPAAPQVQAVFVNLVAITPSGPGNLKAWATGTSEPTATALNYQLLSPNLNVANGIAVPISQTQQSGDLTIKASVSNTHLVVDVVGYFTHAMRSGDLRLGSQEGNSGLYFYDNGSPTGKALAWQDSLSTFELSGPLKVVGALSQGSSVTLKERFSPIEPAEILEKVSRLPISSWQYRQNSDGRHIGPTAEAFYGAFGLGRGDGTITAVDADGVALAAIQALYGQLLARDREIEQLKQDVRRLEERLSGTAACHP